jgi:hypothetical protein
VSHKDGYGEPPALSGKRLKRMRTALVRASTLLHSVYRIGFEMGFLEGKRQTTTSSGSGRLSGNNYRVRSAKPPTGRKK